MATLVFGMNQSLDGYVDHMGFAPGPGLFQHFIDQAREQTGGLYGRRLYEIMRYWDEDQPEWDAPEQAFAEAWRAQHKWVVSTTLSELGPNATLISDGLEEAVRKIKAEEAGEIELGGPVLAKSLGELGLIDTYRIYLHPVVLGAGNAYFATARPPLRFVSSEPMGEGVVRLTYVPA